MIFDGWTQAELQALCEDRVWPRTEYVERSHHGLPSRCRIWTGSVVHGNHPRMVYRSRHVMVARLVFMAYRDPIPPGWKVAHSCGRNDCLFPRDLFLLSPDAARIAAAVRLPRGEDHCRAKLTRRQVSRIRQNGKTKIETLARRYGVSVQTVSDIRGRRTWRDSWEVV